jgi:hypothetical protein
MIDKSLSQYQKNKKNKKLKKSVKKLNKKPRKSFWWGGSSSGYDYEGDAYGTTPAASYSSSPSPSPSPSPSSGDEGIYEPPAQPFTPTPVSDYSTQDLEEQLAIDLGVPTAQYTIEERDEQGYGTPAGDVSNVSDWTEATIVPTPKPDTPSDDQEEDVARMMKNMGPFTKSIDTGMDLVSTQKPIDKGKVGFNLLNMINPSKPLKYGLNALDWASRAFNKPKLDPYTLTKKVATDVFKNFETTGAKPKNTYSLGNNTSGITAMNTSSRDSDSDSDIRPVNLAEKVAGKEDVVSKSVKKYSSLDDALITKLINSMKKRSLFDLENIRDSGSLRMATANVSNQEKDIFQLINDFINVNKKTRV